MARTSAWRGTWQPNARPYVSLSPDAYVAFQGATVIEGCGECKRTIEINDYVTAFSTDASVDSPPGSASINLTIPDTDINNFWIGNQFVVGSMMEVEIFTKGYYLVGGVPRYYRVFWGLVTSVASSWSGGATTVTISCRDILHWWEITNLIKNPSFVEANQTQAGGWQLWQNYLAGMNPYAVILLLAKEAMGDLSFNQFSFLAFRPEKGVEAGYANTNLQQIMDYWQLKFQKIWTSLVLFGASGQIYLASSFDSQKNNVINIAKTILEDDARKTNLNPNTKLFTVEPSVTKAFRRELNRVGVELFQHESDTKLHIAMQARDQIGYEFFMDPCGDIVFKPPFFNMNVMPNKPISWIQNFELIEDSISENADSVVTHLTSYSYSFAGYFDPGINDEITTPHTGVIDYHLLKRYGWRRQNVDFEWATNPKKLFYALLDRMDVMNSKRETGTFTIPLRPELRLGFPVYVEKYDSYFYITGISHSYAVGGSATTTLSVSAKRSKFCAPKQIGTLEVDKSSPPTASPTFTVTIPTSASGTTQQDLEILRDPQTGKLLGSPRVVMVYRKTIAGAILSKIEKQTTAKKGQADTKKGRNSTPRQSSSIVQTNTLRDFYTADQTALKASVRNLRYEAAATNAGAYDYVRDINGVVQQMVIAKASSITYNQTPGTTAEGNAAFSALIESIRSLSNDPEYTEEQRSKYKSRVEVLEEQQKRSKVGERITGDNYVIIRPVSDDFGYEVIGHNLYGRNAYIDQGKVSTNAHTNQISLPFTTGYSTQDQSTIIASGRTASDFETMQPQDWKTGAVEVKDELQMTEMNTYTPNNQASLGSSVYVEADNTRSSQLLSDLSPTIKNDPIASALSDCACDRGRGSWLTLLPESIRVLNLDQKTSIIPQYDGSPSLSPASPTNSGPIGGFLNELNDYLSYKFNNEIVENQKRESEYNGSTIVNQSVEAPRPPFTPSGAQNTAFDLNDNAVYAAISRGEISAAGDIITQNVQSSRNAIAFATDQINSIWNSPVWDPNP